MALGTHKQHPHRWGDAAGTAAPKSQRGGQDGDEGWTGRGCHTLLSESLTSFRGRSATKGR